jgi:hypothetical protein
MYNIKRECQRNRQRGKKIEIAIIFRFSVSLELIVLFAIQKKKVRYRL